MDKPNYDKLTTVDQVDNEVRVHKDRIVRKVRERGQIRANRKEAMKAYNDELKEVESSLDHDTAVLDELERHRKLILAGQQAPALKSV